MKAFLFLVFVFTFYHQTLGVCVCGCGKLKRNTLMEPYNLSPLAQTGKLPMQQQPYTLSKPSSSLSMNYNLASKSLQKQGTSSQYSLNENSVPAFANAGTKDPAAKLSDLYSLRLALKAQKDAIKTMEEQLAVQISEAARQYGVPQQMFSQQPSSPKRSQGYGEQTIYQQPLNSVAPSAAFSGYPSPYPTPYAAPTANQAFQMGLEKENNLLTTQAEGQDQAMVLPNMKPMVSPQMAYSPYSTYATGSSNSAAASTSYTGGSSSTSLGYQTAVV